MQRKQNTPLILNSYQKNIVAEPKLRYRRIKGPAGSGKSLIVAARAAELADRGMHVLVVCFNITLIKYLRDLSLRYNLNRLELGTYKRKIEFVNYHFWCKRICQKYNYGKKYNELWKEKDGFSTDHILNEKLSKLVQDMYQKNSLIPKYDAILVDEGQDFFSIWWQTLRHAVKKDGEMILAADITQNIYLRDISWTDGEMNKAGFRGPWNKPKSKTSHRLPAKLIPYLEEFFQ